MEAARSILIPDGEDELALRVLRCLAEVPSLKVASLSRDGRAPIRFSRHLSRFLTHSVDGSNRERIEVIKEAARAVDADIIFPTGLLGIRLVTAYREELATIAHLPPLASTEILDLVADKLLFSEILEREGIPYPKIVRPTCVPVEEEQLAGIRFPVLVKPRTQEAGNGIRLCNSPHEALEYLAEQSNPFDFFIQEFISGVDLGCSVLTLDGEILAYTMQRGIVPSHKPFHPPAAVEFVHRQDVFDSIQRLVRAVKYSGVVNFDLILDKETNEAKVLEANPRYWRSLLGSLKAGVNFPYLAALASEGRPVHRPDYRNVRYAKPELALEGLVKRWSGNQVEVPGLSESGVSFMLKDPLPDLAIQLSRVSRHLFG